MASSLALRLLTASVLGLAATAPGLAASRVYWASDTVRPDDTVLVTGAHLDEVGKVMVARVPDAADAAESHEEAAEILGRNRNSLKFIVPATLADGIFRYRIVDKDGSERSGLLNAPTVYWLQGDAGDVVTDGGWLRVLGRNIARNAGSTVLLKSESGAETTLTPKRGNLWDAAFDIPANLAPGVYDVTIRNGSGGKDGAAPAGRITIGPRPAAKAVRLSVHDFGADGYHGDDDTPALQATLDAVAQKGGGVAYLPRGNYKLSGTLTIPDGVTLKGEARDLVNLVWSDFKVPPPSLITGYAHFAVEDLSIVATNHAHVISGGFAPPDAEDGSDIAIRRVLIRASAYRGHLDPKGAAGRLQSALKLSSGGGDSIRLAGRNLTVEDCDVLGSGRSLYLLRARGAHIARNTLYNGRLGWYSITSSRNVIFENNTIEGADLQSTGGGVNTLTGRGDPVSENMLFYKNRYSRMLGWDREALTTDGAGGFYYGAATVIDERTLGLSPKPVRSNNVRAASTDWTGASVFVLDGDGKGLMVRVASGGGDTVTVDRPLPLAIGSQAKVSILQTQQHYLMIENEFADAGVAVQFFGTAFESIVYGNKSSRTGGYLVRAIEYLRGIQPSWYTQILDNEILVGNAGPSPMIHDMQSLIGLWGWSSTQNGDALNYGAVVRRNRLDGNSTIDVRTYSAPYPGVTTPVIPGVSTALIEKNTVANTDIGISVDKGARDILLRDNKFEKIDHPILIEGSADACTRQPCAIK